MCFVDSGVREGLYTFLGDTFSVDETWLMRDSKAVAGPSISIGSSFPQHQHQQSETERQMIEAALAVTRGRIAGPKGAAAKLGIPRQTLDSKITARSITFCSSRMLPGQS